MCNCADIATNVTIAYEAHARLPPNSVEDYGITKVNLILF